MVSGTLTPRWRKDLVSNDEDERYIGGTDKYDIWARASGTSFRVVWGNQTNEWDTYYYRTNDYYHKELGRPIGRDHNDIMLFLKLFAPEQHDKLQGKENVT